MIRSLFLALIASPLLFALAPALGTEKEPAHLGPRPFYLVDRMEDGPLKDKLKSCFAGPFHRSDWSMGHRGATLQFPEHSAESYLAAIRMGAGKIECDVTFTKDRQLVCRHAEDDLHRTTDILATPLAQKCTAAFSPATTRTITTGEGENVRLEKQRINASADCRTSDITLAEFESLNGRMDAVNRGAKNAASYNNALTRWRTELYATKGTVMSHKASIRLLEPFGVKFVPELKEPVSAMPFEGDYSHRDFARQFIDEYRSAGISPSRVYPQTFSLDYIRTWQDHAPDYAENAVWMDSSYRDEAWSPHDPATWRRSMEDLKAMGINIVAPPFKVLLAVEDGKLVASEYAKRARAAGLKIVTWTVERSGHLSDGGGWYYQGLEEIIDGEGAVFKVLHALNEEVGVMAVFSDWPATTTFYANCFGLE